MKNPWKTLGSKLIYRNPWMAVREDRVIQPDGKPSIYGVVELKPYVGVVPFDGRHVYLVRQWRYAQKENVWEVPTGSRDGREGILAAARRELAEEVGFRATRWTLLGTLCEASAITSARGQMFLAEGLSPVPARLEGSEADLVVKRLTWGEAMRWIDRHKIIDGVSVAALYLASRVLARRATRQKRR